MLDSYWLTAVAVILDAARDSYTALDSPAFGILAYHLPSFWRRMWSLHCTKRSEAECELIFVTAELLLYNEFTFHRCT